MIASLAEKAVFAYFSDLKKNIAETLRTIPDKSVKLYFSVALLLFLVVLGVSGVLLLTVGAVCVFAALTADSVNKLLLCGILLACSGLFYFTAGAVMIRLIGSLIHTELSKNLEKITKKFN